VLAVRDRVSIEASAEGRRFTSPSFQLPHLQSEVNRGPFAPAFGRLQGDNRSAAAKGLSLVTGNSVISVPPW
jgi:hypothetical protein